MAVESRYQTPRPVVALDIDGTSGRYHEHFHWFAQLYLGRELPLDWRPEFRGEFNRALHITKRTYREIKLAYRQGGMKRCMPVMFAAQEFTAALRRRGAEVWVCTTRPYLRLDNIDPDTRHWLDKRARIRHDGVLYGDNKYADLIKIVGIDNVVAVVDDLPEQVESATGLGMSTVMMAGAHNAWWRSEDSAITGETNGTQIVWNLDGAARVLFQKLEDWKEQNHG